MRTGHCCRCGRSIAWEDQYCDACERAMDWEQDHPEEVDDEEAFDEYDIEAGLASGRLIR
jgi:hypothetical protein